MNKLPCNSDNVSLEMKQRNVYVHTILILDKILPTNPSTKAEQQKRLKIFITRIRQGSPVHAFLQVHNTPECTSTNSETQFVTGFTITRHFLFLIELLFWYLLRRSVSSDHVYQIS